jgi:pilus assembly protein CpaC
MEAITVRILSHEHPRGHKAPMKKDPRTLRAVAVSSGLVVTMLLSPAWAEPPEKSLTDMTQPTGKSFTDMINKFSLTPAGDPGSEMLAKATVAINFIKKMELTQANKAVNEALQLDARNSYLHFLNGFVYHLQARQGDAQKNEMAIEGYQQALRIDPGNWVSREFLGLAYLDLKQFDLAKDQFSEVLLMSPDSTVSLYGVMVASYLTGDAVMACAMADQFKKIATEPHDGFIRSGVLVYASCGDFGKAAIMRADLEKLNLEPLYLKRLDNRIAQWKAFYREQSPSNPPTATDTVSGFVQANLSGVTADASPVRTVEQPNPTPTSAPNENDGSPRMVLIDVVLVSTQELISATKGINLLNALTLQLGSSTAAAYSRVNTSNSASGADATTSAAITRALTIPALAYSMNIANANDSMNEVLARPTLAAMEGLPSEFFSGTNLNAGVVSSSVQGGTTIVPLDKRFGIKLAVIPTFLPSGKVQLKVDAQRTSLNTTADNPKVAYQIEIAEITANANIVMNLGDTLVLSGLSEKASSKSRDGVPVLQDIPVIQYLFSNKKSFDYQRSVLIMITPRAPVYTAKAEASSNAAMNARMKAFREKIGFPAHTTSNVEAVLHQLKTNDFFREFRQGDVVLERWDSVETTGDRLKQALGFLYY